MTKYKLGPTESRQQEVIYVNVLNDLNRPEAFNVPRFCQCQYSTFALTDQKEA